MRADRLLSLLMLLQTRGRMSVSILAAELSVSTRTVLRDLEHLSAAGTPVWSERGRNGGFMLREGWTSTPLGLTEAEAQALFLAGLPSAALELGLAHAPRSAHLKVLAALPEKTRRDAARVQARLHVDPLDWYRAPTPAPHLQTVARAVWKQNSVRMRYASWRGVKHSTVRPLGLVLKAGVWYMAASSARRAAPRIYRLDQIQELSVAKGTFAYPHGFHLPTFWQAATQRFEASLYPENATLRVTAAGMKAVCAIGARVAQAATDSARPDPRHPGWVRITIPIESVAHATNQLLGLGTEAQALAPAALRERIRATLGQLSAFYAKNEFEIAGAKRATEWVR